MPFHGGMDLTVDTGMYMTNWLRLAGISMAIVGIRIVSTAPIS
jgi:hypothetical protein